MIINLFIVYRKDIDILLDSRALYKTIYLSIKYILVLIISIRLYTFRSLIKISRLLRSVSKRGRKNC